MLFQGAGETYADLSDFRVAPLKLVGVELEYKASKNDPNKAVNTTRRPGVVRQSRAPHSNRHSGINMRANVAHADPGACRWYIVLVRPASLRRPASIVAAEPLSPNSTLYTAKHEEATTSGLVLASSLSSSCLSFKCYSSGEEDDNASTNDGISIFNNVSGQTKQHHADCTSDEPYMVRRTFYQFRLLIVGLYREFLDKPNIIAPLREAATDIFSACPEAERLCVHALLDVFLIVSPEQAALLGSRSVAEFFSKWPADRTREELEQATSDINGLFDAWDDLQNKPADEERPVYSSKASVWSMDLTVPASPDRPNTITDTSSAFSKNEMAPTGSTSLRRSKSVLASVGIRAMRKAVGKASSIFANNSSTGNKSSTNLSIQTDHDSEQSSIAGDTPSLRELPQSNADEPAIGKLFADELISALEKVTQTNTNNQDNTNNPLLTPNKETLPSNTNSIYNNDNISNISVVQNGPSLSHAASWENVDEMTPKLARSSSTSADAANSVRKAMSTHSVSTEYDSNDSIANDCDSGNGPSISSGSRCSSSFELISSANDSSQSSLKIASPPTRRSLSIRKFRKKQKDNTESTNNDSSNQELSVNNNSDSASIISESSRLSRRLTGSFRVVRKSVMKRTTSKNSPVNTDESTDSKDAPLPSVEVTAPLTEIKTSGAVAPRRVASFTSSNTDLLGCDADMFDSGHLSDIEPRPMTVPTPRSSTPPASIRLGGGSRASTSNLSERRAALGKLQAEAPWNARRNLSSHPRSATETTTASSRLSVDVHTANLVRSQSARVDLPRRPQSLIRTASTSSLFSNASSLSLSPDEFSLFRALTAPGTPCSPNFINSSVASLQSPPTPSVYVHPAADDYWSAVPPSPIDPLCDLPVEDEERAGDIVVQIALDRKNLVRLIVPRSCTLEELCNQAEDKFMRCLEREQALQGRELLYVQRDGRALLVVNDAALGRVLARAVDRVAIFRVW